MDFKPFDGPADAGADLVVLDPGTLEPTDVVITLAGQDSKAWRRATREAGRRAMDSVRDGGGRKALELTESNGTFVLARATLAWKNVELDGKQLECTQANAEMLYSTFPWLREQVDRFVGDRSRFFCPARGVDTGGGTGTGQADAPAEGSQA